MAGANVHPRWLEAWLGWPGAVMAFSWGFAEGTLFFVVPDLAFTLTSAFRPSRGLVQLALATTGALVAGCLMYSFAASNAQGAKAVVARVPFVGEAMVEKTDQRLASLGAGAMFDSPLGGVPYKVYAVLAPRHFSRARFLLLSIPARAERMLISWIPVALLARALRRLPEARRRRVVLIAYALSWICIYSVYWGKLSLN